MNGIPLKFDFSKTLNEQLATFEYYKTRYQALALQVQKLNEEKYEIIDYLEEKVKLSNIDIERLSGNYNVGFDIIEKIAMKKAYQEVLDLINRGGKNNTKL